MAKKPKKSSKNVDADDQQNDHQYVPTERPAVREERGSGSDINSDTSRLSDPENLQDKREEDSFPASDPPSTMVSIEPGAGSGERLYGETEDQRDSTSKLGSSEQQDPSGLPANFKDDPKAQFEYGRRSQASTQHIDRSTNRLRHGNPDVGQIDLGIVEADKPVQPDDNDHYDTPDDPDGVGQKEY